jgi:MoaA/NifB/PqqE/SkfB family radical SAM enzyme
MIEQVATEAGSGRKGMLMLHLLGRCNLSCLHCYMEGSPSRREVLPLDWVLKAIAECEQLGIGSLYVTGGEPLLYRGLSDVLTAAASVPGLIVTVCTNATFLTQRHAVFFRELGLSLNVSIDGEPDFHDRFRNRPGAFRAAERGVQLASEVGIRVNIVSTISQLNLQSLPSIVQWAAGSGAVEFRVQPLLKLGRGDQIADQCLTPTQMNLLYLQLSDLANLHRSSLRCSLIGLSRRFALAHPCGAYVCNGVGCHRRVAKEIKKLVVRENGTVLPEVTNLHRSFALGSIEDGPLSMLVDRYFKTGYERFDQLCRIAYAEVLPNWPTNIVPWDQILAERSQFWRARSVDLPPAVRCGTCAPHRSADGFARVTEAS